MRPSTARTFLAALLGAASIAVSAAPRVMVMSLGQDRADLVINGTVIRSLRSGQTSPEGVRLISAIDTGATFVAIPAAEAARMAIRYSAARRVQIRTAGGAREGYRVKLANIRIGDISLNDVDGVVMAGGADGLEAVVIGMSFLNGVEMLRAGDTLTLTQRR